MLTKCRDIVHNSSDKLCADKRVLATCSTFVLRNILSGYILLLPTLFTHLLTVKTMGFPLTLLRSYPAQFLKKRGEGLEGLQ